MKTLQTMACAIAFAMPQLASAQKASSAEGPAATKAAAQLNFKSAFSDYNAYEDMPVADWRQVNDAVRQAATRNDGHVGSDAAKSSGPASPAPGGAAGRPPMPMQEHKGHGMHGRQQ